MRKAVVTCCAAAVAAAAGGGSARGDDVVSTWEGGAGRWFDAARWQPDGVPNNAGGTSYGVVLPSGVANDVVADADVTVTDLTAAGAQGVLRSEGLRTLTVERAFRLEASLRDWGRVVSNGELLIGPGAPLTDLAQQNVVFDINGTARWAGVRLHGSNARFNIAPAATFDIQGDDLFDRDAPGTSETSVINNAGLLLRSTGTGTARLRPDLINTGTLEVRSGVLEVERGTSSGTIRVAPGASLLFNRFAFDISGAYDGPRLQVGGGQVTIKPGATFSGLQEVSLGEGRLQFDTGATVNLHALRLDGIAVLDQGTFGGSDSVTVTGPAVTRGGVLEGTGSLTLAGTGSIEHSTLTLRRYRLNVAGTTSLRTKMDSVSPSRLEILPSGVFNLEGDNDALVPTTNAGTLRKAGGAGVSTVSSLSSTGRVEVVSGTLQLTGGTGSVGGTVTGSPGAFVEFSSGTHTIAADARVDAVGVQVRGTATVRVTPGARVEVPLITVDGGELNLTSGSVAGSPVNLQRGGVSGNGTVGGTLSNLQSGVVTVGAPLLPDLPRTLTIAGDYAQAAAAALYLDIGRLSLTGRLTSDLLAVEGDADVGGTIQLFNAFNHALAAGDAFDVIRGLDITDAGYTAVLPTLAPGLSWNHGIVPLATGGEVLRFSVVPEPTQVGAMVLGACFVCRRRRR